MIFIYYAKELQKIFLVYVSNQNFGMRELQKLNRIIYLIQRKVVRVCLQENFSIVYRKDNS